MRYGFDNLAGRLRPPPTTAHTNNGKFSGTEVKRTTMAIPTKESSNYFLGGQTSFRPVKVKQTNAPAWIGVAVLVVIGFVKYNNYKITETAFAENKRKELDAKEAAGS